MANIRNYIRINPLDLNKNVAIGVALPFNADGVFNQTFTQKEQVKSNLINVLLTEKGERINLPDFGVGLKNILFETNVDTNKLEDRIDTQIKITYRYNPSNEIDAIQLNFNSQR